jgi:hypothetical protein
MSSIFDQFSLLDDARARRQIEAAHAALIFDQWSHDPARAERQIAAALNTTFDAAYWQDDVRALAEIDAALSGGGGGNYVAKAVHLDGGSCLYCGNLSVSPTNDKFTCVFFVNNATFSNGVFLAVDELNSPALQDIYFDSAKGLLPDMVDATDQLGLMFQSGLAPLTSPGWHSVLFNCQTNFSAGNKLFQLYVDDVSVGTLVQDVDAAFDMPFNGLPIYIMGSGLQGDLIGDFSNVWIAPGQIVDFSVTANRRKFITAANKPVNLGVDGSAPTGVAPAIFFAGDDTTFGTNAGSGGSFKLVQSLYTDGSGTGRNGAGPIAVTGAVAGKSVATVWSTSGPHGPHDISGSFESVISVNDQIQQTASTDLSSDFLAIQIVQGTMANATTSPSD